jgi:hypothetical protein
MSDLLDSNKDEHEYDVNQCKKNDNGNRTFGSIVPNTINNNNDDNNNNDNNRLSGFNDDKNGAEENGCIIDDELLLLEDVVENAEPPPEKIYEMFWQVMKWFDQTLTRLCDIFIDFRELSQCIIPTNLSNNDNTPHLNNGSSVNPPSPHRT